MRYPESIPAPDAARRAERRRFPLGKAAILFFVAGIGLILGNQIVNPSKRVIEAAAGALLVYVLWNSSTLNALWIFILIYPFPFAISAGNSTFVFAIIIFLIYLIRVSARIETLRFDRRFNLPIVLFVMSYLVSFYNLSFEPYTTRFALVHTASAFASILVFYLVINCIDSEERLAKTMRFFTITAVLVIAFTVLEMLFPGRELIPGWLYTSHKLQLIMKDVRMGGPFHDFELVAEFFAMNAPIIFFLLVRSRRLLTRTLLALLLVADVVMLFTTMTRGAFISLLFGVVYMAWVCRRDLHFVRFVLLAGAFAALILVIDLFVSRYTISGSLIGRMARTTFESGIIPENRASAWGGAVARGMEHPIIGHGPGWNFTKGLEAGLWPHNAYLYYFNITGLFGLLAFLFFLWRLWKASAISFGGSIVRSPFPEALMIALNVSFVIFIVDQIKIDYPRNDYYMFFIWLFFGLIAATRNIIAGNGKARPKPGPAR